jgi:hypothetical protein
MAVEYEKELVRIEKWNFMAVEYEKELVRIEKMEVQTQKRVCC